ncbi:MFS transporter [Halorarius halobius]|uniref:MFS transporter n=1 Tax=Halorarius halobius TaxID=2962671 RepID=UPI0020CC1F91|nr:MFS transporter [Halorarius halobius]
MLAFVRSGARRLVDARATEPRQWGTVAGLWVLMAACMAYIIVPASVLPLIMTDLGLGPTAASWVVSVMFGMQALASTPTGFGLDRFDNRVAVTVATAVFLVGGAWGWQAAATGDFLALLASRALAGVGVVLAWNASANLSGRAFGPDLRATVLGVFTASAPAGFVIGQVSGPLVAARFGWPAVFVAYCGLAVVGLLVFLASTAGTDLSEHDAPAPEVLDFKRVFTNVRVWHVAVMGFMAYSLYVFMNSWMPTYLAQEFGFSLANSGLAVALFPAVGILSRSGGGAVADTLFDARRKPVVLLSFVCSAPLVALVGVVGTPLLLFGLVVLSGLFIQLSHGLLYTYVQELVDPNVAGTATAFLTSVSVFGSFTAPIIAGWLIERTGSFTPAFGYGVVVAVAGVALAWIAPEVGPAAD